MPHRRPKRPRRRSKMQPFEAEGRYMGYIIKTALQEIRSGTVYFVAECEAHMVYDETAKD